MTLDMTHPYEWRGRPAVDREGGTVGKVEEIYLDQETGELAWALVHTGLFGSRSTFVPLVGASPSGAGVALNWDRATIKGAPSIEPDGDLSSDEEAQLYSHYGVPYGEPRSDAGGRVRLRKYVVTEQVQTTF